MNRYTLEYETDKLYKSLLSWFESTRYWPPLAGDFAWLACWLEVAGNLDVEFRETFNRLPLSDFTRENDKYIFTNITTKSYQLDSVLFKPDYKRLFWASDWRWLHKCCVMFSQAYPHRHVTSHSIKHWIEFHNAGAGLEGDYTNYVKLPSWSNHLPTDFTKLIARVPKTNEQAYFMDFS